MEIRAVTSADLPALRAITLATGQSVVESGADPAYVALLQRGVTIRGTGGALVAVEGDDVLGWAGVVSTPLGSLLSDLFVDPSAHGRGVGTALLRSAGPVAFTFSSRHPAAMPLYRRGGLTASWPLLYLSGPVDRLPVGALRVSPVEPAVAASVEATLTGAPPRTEVYEYWADTFVVHDGTRPVAAGATRRGEPSVLTHLTTAMPGALFAAVAALGSDHAAFCVPAPHPAVRLLQASGFHVDDSDVLMTTPAMTPPPEWIYSPGLG